MDLQTLGITTALCVKDNLLTRLLTSTRSKLKLFFMAGGHSDVKWARQAWKDFSEDGALSRLENFIHQRLGPSHPLFFIREPPMEMHNSPVFVAKASIMPGLISSTNCVSLRCSAREIFWLSFNPARGPSVDQNMMSGGYEKERNRADLEENPNSQLSPYLPLVHSKCWQRGFR